jgi:hypothetical protein
VNRFADPWVQVFHFRGLYILYYIYTPLFSLHFIRFLSVPFGTFFSKAFYLPTLLAVVLDDDGDDDGLLRLAEDYGYI